VYLSDLPTANRMKTLLLLFTAIYLAACGSPTVEPTPSATTEPPPPPPTSIPSDTPVPTPTETPFVPKAIIKIAFNGPLTGEIAQLGLDGLHASEIAVEQQSGALNKLGYKIELVSYDHQFDIDTAVANTKQIIDDPEVLCAVGNITSRIYIQTSELYHKAGLASISPSATSTTVTNRFYDEVNRIVGRNDWQGITGANFTKEQGFNNVYIISQSWEYNKKISEFFQREANRIGVKIVGSITTDINEAFEGVISRMQATNPELVFFAGAPNQVGQFIREARAAGYNGAFLGTDAIAGAPGLLDAAGPLILDGGGMYYINAVAPADFYQDADPFVQEFQNKFGATPQMFSAQSYDVTWICMQAIERASKAKNGEIPTRAEVVDTIRTLGNYEGITRVHSFDKNGDPAVANYFIYQVTSVDQEKWDQNPVVASYGVTAP